MTLMWLTGVSAIVASFDVSASCQAFFIILYFHSWFGKKRFIRMCQYQVDGNFADDPDCTSQSFIHLQFGISIVDKGSLAACWVRQHFMGLWILLYYRFILCCILEKSRV